MPQPFFLKLSLFGVHVRTCLIIHFASSEADAIEDAVSEAARDAGEAVDAPDGSPCQLAASGSTAWLALAAPGLHRGSIGAL